MVASIRNGHAALSDYGLASAVDTADVDLTDATRDSWRYESPEVLRGSTKHNLRSDIWTWGSLFYRIVINKAPFIDETEPEMLLNRMGQAALPVVVEDLDVPPRAQNLLGRCWGRNPESRASAGELVGILDGNPFRFKEVKTIAITEQNALRISQDAKLLALASKTEITVYETDSWEARLSLSIETTVPGVQCLQISTSGHFLAACDETNDIFVWDLRSGKLASRFSGHKDWVWGVDISADDAFVTSASSDKDPTMRLWYLDGQADKNRVMSAPDNDNIYSIAISPDSTYVAGGLRNNAIAVWSIQSGSHIVNLPDPYGWVRCVQFSPDGKWLFGGNGNGAYTRWEVGSLQPEPKAPTYSVFPSSNTIVSMSISPDNSWFVFLSEQGDLRPVAANKTLKPTIPTIGKLPASGIWRKLHLGPVSNLGSGYAAGFAGDSGKAVIAQYASWDSPGAYRFHGDDAPALD
ncbi:hypothetical protein FRB99_001279 [Tulasnella sp. 403]|nr:hypothetical protein FRB99_001279 [Tulasnella sp. 403]